MKKKFRVSIDRSLCKGCSLCVSFCPKKNFSLRDGHLVFDGDCIGCMLCARYCPDYGIRVEETKE